MSNVFFRSKFQKICREIWRELFINPSFDGGGGELLHTLRHPCKLIKMKIGCIESPIPPIYHKGKTPHKSKGKKPQKPIQSICAY